MKDFFCPNCGKKLKAGTKFCPYCGTDVSQVANATGSQPEEQVAASEKDTAAPQTAATVHDSQRSIRPQVQRTVSDGGSLLDRWKQHQKRNNSILVLVILVVIFLIWGHFYYSESNQMSRAVTAIGDPAKNAGKYVTSTSSEVKINNKTVKPIQKYFQKYPGDLDSLKSNFQDGSKWHDYQFVQKGRAWLIWPRYKIQANPTHITVNTDQKGMNITMDGQELGTVTSNNATSDSDTSDVNSNNNNSGSTASYSRSFGPYLPGLHRFVGTKTAAGHQIKSVVNSSDDEITMNNGVSNDTAQSILSNVFQRDVDDQDEDFIGGQNNEGYKQLVKMFDGFQDDDDIESYDAKVNVNSVTPLSDSKFRVNYSVKFTFENKKGDDDDFGTNKRIQVFKYSGILKKTNDTNNSYNGFKIQSLGHAKKVSESNEDEN